MYCCTACSEHFCYTFLLPATCRIRQWERITCHNTKLIHVSGGILGVKCFKIFLNLFKIAFNLWCTICMDNQLWRLSTSTCIKCLISNVNQNMKSCIILFINPFLHENQMNFKIQTRFPKRIPESKVRLVMNVTKLIQWLIHQKDNLVNRK